MKRTEMGDYRSEFTNPDKLVCPKCKCADINVRLVTITPGPDYIRWECSRCDYYDHMKPSDAEKSIEPVIKIPDEPDPSWIDIQTEKGD